MCLAERVVNTEFRIDEIVATGNIKPLHRTNSVIEVVVHTRNKVRNMAILHIGIEI